MSVNGPFGSRHQTDLKTFAQTMLLLSVLIVHSDHEQTLTAQPTVTEITIG